MGFLERLLTDQTIMIRTRVLFSVERGYLGTPKTVYVEVGLNGKLVWHENQQRTTRRTT